MALGTDQPAEFGVPDELYFEYRDSVPALEDLALYGTGSSTSRAAAQVTPGGFGPSLVARMKPGTDRAALVAELEPLARRAQQRLGGPRSSPPEHSGRCSSAWTRSIP